MSQSFTADDVKHVASLAAIPVTEQENKSLSNGFNTVMKVLDTLRLLDVTGVEPTYQVTGLINVMRDDEVDESRMFTQEQALANAPRKYKGYFLVDQIISQDV